jgi:predicted DNA-binding transcriptional regulator YafY
MASREFINIRRKEILDRLSAKTTVSIEELMTIGNAKKRTILDDISNLRKAGNVIEIVDGNVTLKERTDVVVRSSKSVMRKVRIIAMLNRYNGATKEKLFKSIVSYSEDFGDDEKEKRQKLDAERKNLDNDLKSLIMEGMIQEEGGLFETTILMPKAIQLEDKSILTLYETIVNDGSSVSYGSILDNIGGKIEEALQYKLYLDIKKISQPVLIRDNKEKIDKYEDILRKIFKLPFRTKMLSVEAKNRYGTIYEKIIAVEKIVYLSDTGRLYLIGQEHDLPRRSIVEFSRILNVETTELENSVYDNDDVKEVCSTMLRISIEREHRVLIELEDTESIKERLSQLMVGRRDAELSITDGKIIYKDCIRGIDDIAKFVRGFGAKCIVHEDEELRNRMIESSKRVLERYGYGE